MPDVPLEPALLEPAGMTDDNIIHFNPWGDFNDAPAQVDPFGAELDREQARIDARMANDCPAS